MEKIRKSICSYSVKEEQELSIAFDKVFSNTSDYFRGFRDSTITEIPINDQRFCLDNIYIGFGKYRFGWIQQIEIDLENKVAQVGHIATDINFTRKGLGKKIVHAFGERLKNDYGIEKIHFCERTEKAVYSYFFTQKLGAVYVKSEHGEKWIWKIPEDIS